jgi:hypothetical protein
VSDQRAVDRTNWDERAPAHAASPGYVHCHIATDTISLARLGGRGRSLQTDATFVPNRTIRWDHGLGEIVTALPDHGLGITVLVEHDGAPWEPLPGRMERLAGGRWRLAERPERLPHTCALQARRRAVV